MEMLKTVMPMVILTKTNPMTATPRIADLTTKVVLTKAVPKKVAPKEVAPRKVARIRATLTLAPTVMLQVKVARINLVRMMVGKLMAALAQDTRKSLQNLAVERRPCLRRLQRGP